MATFEMSQSSPRQMIQNKKIATRCVAAVALGAIVGTMCFFALEGHATADQQSYINLSIGCVKDHIGSEVKTWTPSGVLDADSDMISDCQVTNNGQLLGSARKFMTATLPLQKASAAYKATAVRTRVVPVEMVNVAEIRDRIESVKSTQKITSAMKMVAAAKVRRAQEAVLKSRPFNEALEGVLGGLLEKAKAEVPDAPLLADRPIKTVALLVMSGDRGLCGGYNAQIIKKTTARIEELQSQGVAVQLYLFGNKASAWFKKRETPVILAEPIGTAASAEQANKITERMLASYYEGDIDRVELIYTNFVSMISFVPKIRTMIPLFPNGMEMEGDELIKMTTKDGDISLEKEKMPVASPKKFEPDVIYEQDPALILDGVLKIYLNGQILRVLQEGIASELASRVTAMQAATDNAKELKEVLTLEMNRARQAAITQELMEIIAGANAV